MANDLLVSGAARLEVGLRRGEGRKRFGAASLGLCHVGARHLADIEAVLGRLELLGQHLHVVLAQADDGRVAHDVHIGRRSIEEDGLLDRAQGLARSLHRRLRLADGIQILEALEERLRELNRPATGMASARGESTG